MVMVRVSKKGIAKSYGLSVKRVRSRLKKLGIKPKGGIRGNRLYSLEDAKAVGDYRKNRKLAKAR